ncbi:MAG: hypothetical protein Q8900_02910 [Bacillota bacterium]|nr:hypothetical protein [Bacillota bacterium]
MDIDKAIKKQNKVCSNFVISMGFIFFALPIVMVILKKAYLLYLFYLGAIEILILFSVYNAVNNIYLKYENKGYKIKVKNGLLFGDLNIYPEKIAMVHTQNKGNDMSILLIMSSKLRNSNVKPVSEGVLLSKGVLSDYTKYKKSHTGEGYFYYVIDKGGYEKYKLLQDIYKWCVQAAFTDESIERIKEIKNGD